MLKIIVLSLALTFILSMAGIGYLALQYAEQSYQAAVEAKRR